MVNRLGELHMLLNAEISRERISDCSSIDNEMEYKDISTSLLIDIRTLQSRIDLFYKNNVYGVSSGSDSKHGSSRRSPITSPSKQFYDTLTAIVQKIEEIGTDGGDVEMLYGKWFGKKVINFLNEEVVTAGSVLKDVEADIARRMGKRLSFFKSGEMELMEEMKDLKCLKTKDTLCIDNAGLKMEGTTMNRRRLHKDNGRNDKTYTETIFPSNQSYEDRELQLEDYDEELEMEQHVLRENYIEGEFELQTHTRVLQISELLQITTQKLIEQDNIMESILDSTVTSTQYVDLARDQLQKAASGESITSAYMYRWLLFSGLAILVLHTMIP